MLDLNKNIIDTEGTIKFDKYYLYYQERSDEFGIDYTILDMNFKLVDGGEYCYGDYNEKTEMYDIDNGTEILTLKEFFDYINEDSNDYNFDENGDDVVDECLLEEIYSNC